MAAENFSELNAQWETDLSKVPPNQLVLVSNYIWDKWAKWDPTWGKGRGMWFDEKNQVVAGVKRWHPDGVALQTALWS